MQGELVFAEIVIRLKLGILDHDFNHIGEISMRRNFVTLSF